MRFWEKIPKPYFAVAPMVGNSEEAWRRLAKRYGANIFYTEMVNCDAFLRGNRNPTKNFWYSTSADDRPLIIQICGNSPEIMLEAALIMQKHCDAIDVNLGCPQKVAKKGYYGAYLQDDWKLITNIVTTLSQNLSIPVVCKIRVFPSIEKSVEYAKMIERAGCSLLAVHGRTREQRGINMGIASWEHIKAIKENVTIPVLSNGNILCKTDIEKCLEYTGCDGVMVAEAHLYNPLIFLGEKKTCLEVIGEYLGICGKHPESAEFKHVKSHLFKLLHTYFKAYPEKQRFLEACNTIREIQKFYLSLLDEKRCVNNNEIYALNPRPLPVTTGDCSEINKT